MTRLIVDMQTNQSTDNSSAILLGYEVDENGKVVSSQNDRETLTESMANLL